MAKNITIAGADYPNVPSITVTITGGGYASFVDTSDATATAADLTAGKTAYANGSKITGTGGASSKYGISLDDIIGNVNSSNVLQLPTGGNVDLTLTTFTNVASYGLQYAFYRSAAIRSVVFQNLTSMSGSSGVSYTFSTCTNLTDVSCPNLTSVSGSSGFSYCFNGCTKLDTALFPKLATITGTSAFQNAFYGCTKLATVDFSKVTTIGNSAATSTNYRHFYQAFYNCSLLTDIEFPELTAIYCNGTSNAYGTFNGNNKVQIFRFPKLTTITKSSSYSNATAANNIFYNCTALTEIHFAYANKTAIEASAGYATKWGAPSACQIIFDKAPIAVYSLVVGEYTWSFFGNNETGFGKCPSSFYGSFPITEVTAGTLTKVSGDDVFSYCAELASLGTFACYDTAENFGDIPIENPIEVIYNGNVIGSGTGDITLSPALSTLVGETVTINVYATE